MFHEGDAVRIKPGAAYSEFTGDAVGTIIDTYVQGVDYSDGVLPAETRVHIVRFPFTVFVGEPDSINTEDELEPANVD